MINIISPTESNSGNIVAIHRELGLQAIATGKSVNIKHNSTKPVMAIGFILL